MILPVINVSDGRVEKVDMDDEEWKMWLDKNGRCVITRMDDLEKLIQEARRKVKTEGDIAVIRV